VTLEELLQESERLGPLLPGGDLRLFPANQVARAFTVRDTPIGPVYVAKGGRWMRASPRTLARKAEERLVIRYFQARGYRYVGQRSEKGKAVLLFSRESGGTLRVGLLRKGRPTPHIPVWVDLRDEGERRRRKAGKALLLPFSEIKRLAQKPLVEQVHLDLAPDEEGF